MRLVRPGEEVRSDEELVRAFVAGEGAAFEAIVLRHQGLVLALVRRYARGPEDARDLAQKAFLRAFVAAQRVLPRLGGEPLRFKAWLVRVAINVGKNHVRNASRWRFEGETALEHAPSGNVGAVEALEQAEQRHQARAAVLRLPKRQREVLTLRVDGNLSFAEVAHALAITENNAKVHFHHAVKRLKAMMAEGQEEG